jgi:hypothetical protein
VLGDPLVAIVALACLMLTVTFRLNDPDFWQHLAVGKAIWQLGHVPMTHQWSCTYGQPEVLPSWGYRALLWPMWNAGGVFGLFAWRWVTTALVFLGALLVARRLGARGSFPWVVIVVAGLIGRYRSQLRPESLASILLVVEMLILETRRARGRTVRGGSRCWRARG